jgi:hypothetical protein
MTTLAILGGVLGGAGVIAAFVRRRRSRSAGPFDLGLGAAVAQTPRDRKHSGE